MIHIGRQVPRIVLGRGFTSLFRPNEFLLVRWRLAAFILHCTALLCVADYRHSLIVEGSLLPGFSEDDYNHFNSSAQAAVAMTIICLAICVIGVGNARTLRVTGVNLLHALCHTSGGVLLMLVWYYTSHVDRIWHVFYFFSVIPASVEVLAVALSIWRGFDMWK
jgi:hypothetical protein